MCLLDEMPLQNVNFAILRDFFSGYLFCEKCVVVKSVKRDGTQLTHNTTGTVAVECCDGCLTERVI